MRKRERDREKERKRGIEREGERNLHAIACATWGHMARARVHGTENAHTLQVNADIHDAGVYGFGTGLCGGPLEPLT